MSARFFRAALVALLLTPGAAQAEILLDHPWAQVTPPPKALVGRAYVVLTNHSSDGRAQRPSARF